VRIRALVAKEFLDLGRNRAALVPVVIVTLVSLLIPFFVILAVPAMTGRPLGADPALARVGETMGLPRDLSPEIAVEAFLFQQFLLLFLFTPITGAMSLASHAIVGEKQARTLEPLLATPITTYELLVAKVLGALIPTLMISSAGLVLYLAGIAAFADSGVFAAVITVRTLVLTVFIGPAAALVSLQAVIVISSRVNDARTAQQFGVLIILPLTLIFIAQFTGSFLLTVPVMALVGVGLLVVWVFLTLLSVALFERESILTRWR
jgi:ABC-2 type transport system permease protein